MTITNQASAFTVQRKKRDEFWWEELGEAFLEEGVLFEMCSEDGRVCIADMKGKVFHAVETRWAKSLLLLFNH